MKVAALYDIHGNLPALEAVLQEIRNGKFARDWLRETKSGRKRYAQLLAESQDHPIEKVGARLRALMSWNL